MKIILLNHWDNYKTLKYDKWYCKKCCDILAISLSILHNYFDSPKMSFYLCITKFLDKPFFPLRTFYYKACNYSNHHKIYCISRYSSEINKTKTRQRSNKAHDTRIEKFYRYLKGFGVEGPPPPPVRSIRGKDVRSEWREARGSARIDSRNPGTREMFARESAPRHPLGGRASPLEDSRFETNILATTLKDYPRVSLLPHPSAYICTFPPCIRIRHKYFARSLALHRQTRDRLMRWRTLPRRSSLAGISLYYIRGHSILSQILLF